MLAALAKQEAAKGLALPDAERLAPNRKAALQLLLRLPHCNAAVALLLAERFDSLRHVLTRLDVLFPFFFFFFKIHLLFFSFFCLRPQFQRDDRQPVPDHGRTGPRPAPRAADAPSGAAALTLLFLLLNKHGPCMGRRRRFSMA